MVSSEPPDVSGVWGEHSDASRSGIPVVFSEIVETEGEKGIFSGNIKRVTRLGHLDSETLASNLKTLCHEVGEAFSQVTAPVRDYELESFEVQLEVTASGEIRMVGSVSSEVKGGLTLTFSRHGRSRDG